MSQPQDPLARAAGLVTGLLGAAIEFVAPGRRAGFHVDRIVMRGRRIGEILSQPMPDVAEARGLTGFLCSDFAFGPVVLGVQGFWSAKARAAWQSDVRQAAAQLGKEAAALMQLVARRDVDLAAARAQAATVLSAAEDLRTRAYAFEDRRRPS